MNDLRHATARCSSPWSAMPTQSEQGTHPANIYARVLQITSSAQACCDCLLRKSGSASESAPYISSIANSRVSSPQSESMRNDLSLRMSSRIVVRAEFEVQILGTSWDSLGQACATQCDENLQFRSS